MLLTTHHEVAQACAGFLCGPFEQVDSELGSVDGASDLVGRYKVGINFAIVVIISLPTIFGMVRNVGRDEIGWYIAGSFLIFLIMLVLNWLGDWVFGITNGTTTNQAAALFNTVAVLMPGQGLL